jgi:membrane-bound metal-dependent hydrolase YbcI (DUF457 family)
VSIVVGLAWRRSPSLLPISLLVGLVFGLDLLWAATEGSTGTVVFGLVDEPAHLATCALALLALSALPRRPLPGAFVAAALLASVAIDLDHLPGYLGADLLGEGPRPYTHGLLAAAALGGLGFLGSGRYRYLMLGAAFGLLAHLMRDVATGPGVAALFPLAGDTVRVPYGLYAAALVGLAAAALIWAAPARARRPGARGLSGAAAALVLALALAGFGAPPAGAASGGGASKHRGAEHGKPQGPSGPERVAIGLYVPSEEDEPGALERFTHAFGRQPAILHIYKNWSELPFDHAALDAIWARGSMPLVTWEPWGEFEGTGIPLAEIAGGARDAYIAEAARGAASWGGDLFVRFGHEMNGGWYPWGGPLGNPPALYKAAWRRIVAIFRQEGADNVSWVWTPYADAVRLPFKRYYPGDEWVDWVGLDGFNWGRPFASFHNIFTDSYEKLARLTAKPVMIAETGSVEGEGRKGAWIRRAMTRALPEYPHVRALVWFSDVHPDGTDWRIDTSPGSLTALGKVLRAPEFRVGRKFLLSTPPWLRRR